MICQWARLVAQAQVSKLAHRMLQFRNAHLAKFGCDLAGPVLKPELPNVPRFSNYLGSYGSQLPE
jgi:hypothetical protein